MNGRDVMNYPRIKDHLIVHLCLCFLLFSVGKASDKDAAKYFSNFTMEKNNDEHVEYNIGNFHVFGAQSLTPGAGAKEHKAENIASLSEHFYLLNNTKAFNATLPDFHDVQSMMRQLLFGQMLKKRSLSSLGDVKYFSYDKLFTFVQPTVQSTNGTERTESRKPTRGQSNLSSANSNKRRQTKARTVRPPIYVRSLLKPRRKRSTDANLSLISDWTQFRDRFSRRVELTPIQPLNQANPQNPIPVKSHENRPRFIEFPPLNKPSSPVANNSQHLQPSDPVIASPYKPRYSESANPSIQQSASSQNNSSNQVATPKCTHPPKKRRCHRNNTQISEASNPANEPPYSPQNLLPKSPPVQNSNNPQYPSPYQACPESRYNPQYSEATNQLSVPFRPQYWPPNNPPVQNPVNLQYPLPFQLPPTPYNYPQNAQPNIPVFVMYPVLFIPQYLPPNKTPLQQGEPLSSISNDFSNQSPAKSQNSQSNNSSSRPLLSPSQNSSGQSPDFQTMDQLNQSLVAQQYLFPSKSSSKAPNNLRHSAPNILASISINKQDNSAANKPPSITTNDQDNSAPKASPRKPTKKPLTAAPTKSPSKPTRKPPKAAPSKPPSKPTKKPAKSAPSKPPSKPTKKPPKSAPSKPPSKPIKKPPKAVPSKPPSKPVKKPPKPPHNKPPRIPANNHQKPAPHKSPGRPTNQQPKPAPKKPPLRFTSVLRKPARKRCKLKSILFG